MKGRSLSSLMLLICLGGLFFIRMNGIDRTNYWIVIVLGLGLFTAGFILGESRR